MLSLCPFGISAGVGAFWHRTESDILLFSLSSFEAIYCFICGRRPKGGCCSISGDLYCYLRAKAVCKPQTICWKNISRKNDNVYQKLKHFLKIVISRVLAFWIRFLFVSQNMHLRDLIPKIGNCVYSFENEGVRRSLYLNSYNTCESAFLFSCE